MDGFAGAIGVSDSDGKASPVVHAYRPSARMDVRYVAYVLRTMAANGYVATLAKGVRERSTAFDSATLANVLLPVPPLQEQHRIADFLDAETTRLDRLAVAMHEQDGLLKHRRLRVLDSLSDVHPQPKKARLGYLSLLVTSGSRGWSEYIADGGELFFRSANLYADRIQPKLANTAYVQIPEFEATEGQRARIKRGDVLIGITGANAGWVCLADDAVANGYVSQHVCLVRPDSSRLDSRWLALLAASASVQSELMRSQYGGTKTQLSLPDVRAIRVPVLPVERQAQLALCVERRIESLDRQRALRQRQLQLLAERRQALITAAVTGQFNVTTASGRKVTEGVSV
jgi:type I restriction enzyme S subunit